MNLLGSENLIVLVSLAGDQNHIAWRRPTKRSANRQTPISFHEITALRIELSKPRRETRNRKLLQASLPNARLNFAENRRRLLSTRIIRSHHHEIAQPRGNFTHQRPFAAVAVAAAAKHSDHFTAGQRPHRAENFLQRVRRMRVVDENGNAELVFNLLD